MKRERPSNERRPMENVGGHLFIPGFSRRRYIRCATFKKKDKRTKPTSEMCKLGNAEHVEIRKGCHVYNQSI